MKNSFFLAWLTLILVSCNNNTSDQVATITGPAPGLAADSPVIEIPFSPGNFKGTVPCADCEGIVMLLQVNEDSTWISEETYLGKKEKRNVFYKLGTWERKGDIVSLKTDAAADWQFAIGVDTLFMVEKTGKVINKVTNFNYALVNTPDSISMKFPVIMHGMFTYMADAMRVNLCEWNGKSYPVSLTPKTIRVQEEYAKIIEAPGEAVMLEFQGRLAMQPAMEGNGQEMNIVVEKFLQFKQGEQCRNHY